MSFKDRLQVKLNPAFYWRTALWAGMLAIVLLILTLWFGGSQETTDATTVGRRIIIRLSDGAFENAPTANIKPATTETPPAETPPAPSPAPAKIEEKPAETPPEKPAPESAPVTATPTAAAPIVETPQPAPASPEPQATATPTMQAPQPTPAAEVPVPTNSAAVPLNPIKESLQEKLPIGTLPVIAADGTKPWCYYAKPYELKGTHPLVAIVITGLGQNKNVTAAALKLPENVSLSFSPYAKDVDTWSNAARATGHEVLLDLPMEPSNYPASDPGPYGLLAGKSAEENTASLQWLLGRVQGYIGFATYSNEVYSQNDANFKKTLELLNTRGLMLVMPHEPARKETKQLLDSSKIPYTIADVMLDEELSSDAIQARLTALEKAATKRGFALAYTRGIPLTLQELAIWSAKLEERGYTLVPATYITNHQFKQ